MGLLRLLLALSVVLDHSTEILGFKWLNGEMAVQSFFIISGFYMSLILNEKYNKPESYKLFISNRLLRLFPVYLLIIALTTIAIFSFNKAGIKLEIFSDFAKINFISKIYCILVNLIIVGQDTMMFLGVNAKGGLHYMPHFRDSNPVLWHTLLCPQAWSLSIEIMFYLIAPFIVRRKLKVILPVLIALFALRIIMYLNGLYYDPWTHRFFPTEIAFFLLGNVAYRIYKGIQGKKNADRLGIAMFIAVLGFIFTFNFIPVIDYVIEYLFYISLTVSIPYIFNSTKNSSFDRIVGELSYPVYIIHWFVLVYCLPVVYQAYKFTGDLRGLLTSIVSIVASYIILLLVIRPIDNYREKRVVRYG